MTEPKPNFAYVDESGIVVISEDAVKRLKNMKDKVTTVSLWGSSREENSSTLRQLLKSNVPTAARDGLWLWVGPELFVHGHKCRLLILEGIEGQKKLSATKLFFLASQVSGIFMFSQIGGISQECLARLYYAVTLSKIVGSTDAAILVCLLKRSGEQIPRLYLENVLQPVTEVERTIRSFFKERHCYVCEERLEVFLRARLENVSNGTVIAQRAHGLTVRLEKAISVKTGTMYYCQHCDLHHRLGTRCSIVIGSDIVEQLLEKNRARGRRKCLKAMPDEVTEALTSIKGYGSEEEGEE